ncbi:MAG: rRNA ((527)-N(7))-methyltransferase RsmG [Pseudomonadota bacterium]|jgi:16S rRNA (guanine527-N7)-methyltransferase
MTHLRKILEQGLLELRLELSPEQIKQLLDYLVLLQKWNKVYNLTAISNPLEMVVLHLLDSLVIIPHLKGQTFLDVGTGAGLPGFVLAIARSDWQITLLDSNAKKTRFLIQTMAELGLQNVKVVCSRIEHWETYQRFDVVTSRAYSELGLFCEQCLPFCAPNGYLAAMKGKYPDNELIILEKKALNYQVIPLKVPHLAQERHLVCVMA